MDRSVFNGLCYQWLEPSHLCTCLSSMTVQLREKSRSLVLTYTLFHPEKKSPSESELTLLDNHTRQTTVNCLIKDICCRSRHISNTHWSIWHAVYKCTSILYLKAETSLTHSWSACLFWGSWLLHSMYIVGVNFNKTLAYCSLEATCLGYSGTSAGRQPASKCIISASQPWALCKTNRNLSHWNLRRGGVGVG